MTATCTIYNIENWHTYMSIIDGKSKLLPSSPPKFKPPSRLLTEI